MGRIEKNVINKIILFFDFTVVSQDLVQIGPLVTEIKNVWKKYVQFYMMPTYSKTIANIKKNLSAKEFHFSILRLFTKFCKILSTE